MLTGLPVLGDAGLEFTSSASDHQDSAVGLGCPYRKLMYYFLITSNQLTSNHVLDEVAMAWCINDGHVVLLCLELPQSNVDGDTTLALCLQLVQNLLYNCKNLARLIHTICFSPTQAYLNEPLPISCASFSNFSIVRLSIPPHL
jgi:hypothetical protein